MRKENMLVVVLMVLVLGGIYLYNRSVSDVDTQVNSEPLAAAN